MSVDKIKQIHDMSLGVLEFLKDSEYSKYDSDVIMASLTMAYASLITALKIDKENVIQALAIALNITEGGVKHELH